MIKEEITITRKEAFKYFDKITSKLSPFCLYLEVDKLQLIKTDTERYEKIISSPFRIDRVIGVYNYRLSFAMLLEDLEAAGIKVS